MNNKPLTIILIGRSGSGKGTQAELLEKHFPDMARIETGSLMRDLANQSTEVGGKIKEIIESGGLPYDDLATTLWMHKISYTLKMGQGMICDGFPRRTNEAESLDRFLEWLGRKENTWALLLDVNKDEVFTRLRKRGRNDDADEKIHSRLAWFEERVTPVVEYYRAQGKLIEINGDQPIEDVFKEILGKLVKL